MARRNDPYIHLYVQDFLTDEKLNECSAQAVGVYIKIMLIMTKSEEYGTLCIKQNDKQSESKIENFAYKISKQITFPKDVIYSALVELINERVLQIDGDTLSQKRMVQDARLSAIRAEAGAKGGKHSPKTEQNESKT